MKKNKIIITEGLLRKFFRYEITYKQLIFGGEESDFANDEIDECILTLEDFEALLRNLQNKKVSALDFAENWGRGTVVSDVFCYHYFLDESEDGNEYEPLSRLLHSLESICCDVITGISCYVPDYIDFDCMFESIRLFKEKKYEDGIGDMIRWNDHEKICYVNTLLDDTGIMKRIPSSEDVESDRNLLEELCAKGYPAALEIQGYAYYGGSYLYKCDWTKSRDIMLSLLENEHSIDQNKCQYANTLGYIYYYGRCNNKVPEYEKAFYYFSIGAFGGYYESCYKLADMFIAGKGTPKNELTAVNLISWVYQNSRTGFLHKDAETNFADAALRMGNLYRKGIGFDPDLYYALRCYKLAELAINMRMETTNRYGDDKVKAAIESEINKLEGSMTEASKDKVIHSNIPSFIIMLFDDDYSVKISIKKNKSSVRLTAERICKPDEEFAACFPLVLPEYDICSLVDKVSQSASEIETLWVKDDADSFVADSFSLSPDDEGKFEFYRDNEPVAFLKAKKYSYNIKR